MARRRRNRSDPAPSDIAACYARYSSDLQNESSNDDQISACLELATKNGHTIPLELKFSDSAVSGTKRERVGLNEMLDAAEKGLFSTLYIFSMSRFARETAIAIPLLKRLVDSLGIRVISVSEGFDSNQSSWSLIAGIHSAMSEAYINELGANVHRGQVGNIRNGYSVGDVCFGYRTEIAHPDQPVPKNSKPKKIYLIEDSEAVWVRKIFAWFVDERRSMTWISQELNRLGAPQHSRKGNGKGWRHQYVFNLLRNTKYVGIWPWGKRRNRRDPETGKSWQEQRSREEVEQWTRNLPHLQIIDHDLFDRAQVRLDENRKTYRRCQETGVLRGGGRQSRKHLLSGLFYCGECNSRLYVTGKHKQRLHCPLRVSGQCSCKTQLNLELAQKMVLERVGCLIKEDKDWFARVLIESIGAWQNLAIVESGEKHHVQTLLNDLEMKKSRIVTCIENGDTFDSLRKRLEELVEEEKALNRRLRVLDRQMVAPVVPPDESMIRKCLDRLHEILLSESPAANDALRSLFGKVFLHEVLSPEKNRTFLRGKFAINAMSVTNCLFDGCPTLSTTESDAMPVPRLSFEIDFVHPPKVADPLHQRARDLFDNGFTYLQIASELGVSKSAAGKWVRDSYKAEFGNRDWKRMSNAKRQERPQYCYQLFSEEALARREKGEKIYAIARALGIDRNTAARALRYARIQASKEQPN